MRRYILILMAALLFLAPVALMAREADMVQAEGTAVRAGDDSEVKRKALDQALRKAVLEALRTLLAAESMSADTAPFEAAIASSPKSYILNYRIRSEGWITHLDSAAPMPEAAPESQAPSAGLELYHIWIDASVDMAALRGAVSKISPEAGEERAVSIAIVNVRGYGAYRTLVSALGRVALIKDLSYDSFGRNSFALRALSSADLSALRERIAREIPEGYSVVEGGSRTLIIRPAVAE